MAADIAEQYGKIYQYCYLRVHDQPLAEDLAQETFLRYFSQSGHKEKFSSEKFSPEKQMPYLYTVARNLCIDYFRKNGREELVFDAESWNELEDAKNEFGALAERIAVRQAVALLPKELQEVILMRFVEELPVASIAQILGISRFAVYRLESRALKLLRDRLG